MLRILPEAGESVVLHDLPLKLGSGDPLLVQEHIPLLSRQKVRLGGWLLASDHDVVDLRDLVGEERLGWLPGLGLEAFEWLRANCCEGSSCGLGG